ncbi:ATP-binding protein [Rhodopila sp.]|uniref:ATP-binding protein n=1 Tax=Rhodopila sp. TaxID=2480087 RepID=UPI003D0A9F35
MLGADRAFKVVDGGKSGGGKAGNHSPDPTPDPPDDCPITALGHADGSYMFLDIAGQPRKLSARDLGNRHNLISLFGGDDTWPRAQFPVKKEFEAADGQKTIRTVDFRVNAVAHELIARAARQGLWGKSITLRQPGVWRGEDAMPIVHCGDTVLVGDTWRRPGFRTGKQIWAAAEAIARPGIPCDPGVARDLQQDLQTAWNYKNPAAGIALIGLLYSGWLCGALQWRLNGFVTGPAGSGKSALLKVIRAAWLVHDYSNDTSKAGMEQTIASRAIPALIDEASDRNQSSGRDLLDIVLSSSGDEGTKLARGTVDGKGRTAEIVSSVIMFSIYPPPLQPQHLGRFVLIELQTPPDGADGTENHRRIAGFARAHAAGLWGRAIGALERYTESLMLFRTHLAEAGCSPREMDSKGALLAGWYVMTNDGLPDTRALREGIAALGGFVVTAAQAEADDAPRRALQHLLASHVQLHRSTDREPIGELLETAYGLGDELRVPAAAADLLARNGIRPVLACLRDKPPPDGSACTCTNCFNAKFHKPVPRVGRGAGIWIANRHPILEGIFRNTDFDDRKWLTALARSRDALPSSRVIRIGAITGYAIWLPKDTLLPPEDSS